MKVWSYLILSISVLHGCASPSVLNINNAAMHTSPEQLSQRGDVRFEKVVWGGVIITAVNLQDYTELEVLAYPLRGDLSPNTNVEAIGRFILHSTTYLETADYSSGRKLTVVGVVNRLSQLVVGDASFDVPVLQSEEQHLWPENDAQSLPRFSFGLGISIGN